MCKSKDFIYLFIYFFFFFFFLGGGGGGGGPDYNLIMFRSTWYFLQKQLVCTVEHVKHTHVNVNISVVHPRVHPHT